MKANLVMRASAGTGKTFSLATRFLQLVILQNVKPERILALTFSRNAAREIYTKILERLWTAVAGDDNRTPEECATKERNILLGSLSEAERRKVAAPVSGWTPAGFARILRAVLDSQEADSIATLDSFIVRVVRQFPLETGFQAPAEVLDGYGQHRARADATAALLSGAASDRTEFKKLFGEARGGANARTCAAALEGALEDWRGFLASHPAAKAWTLDSMREAFRGSSTEPLPKKLEDALSIAAAKLRLATLEADAYDVAARRTGLLSFEDFTRCLAACGDEGRQLARQDLEFRLDGEFDHWALDEFQDTSEDQWKCLRNLVREVAGAGAGRGVMVVGDLKQSIYTWRGGNDAPFKEILDWPEFSGERGENIPLPESHRYGARTATFVNQVFGPGNIGPGGPLGNACPNAVEYWRDANCWMEHDVAVGKDNRKRDDDFVEVIGVDKMSVGRFEGDDETTAPDSSGDDEGSAAMKTLAPAICSFVKELWKSHEERQSTEEVGILVRGNKDGAAIAEKLRAAEIPVVWEGLDGILDSPVVRAVLELLRLAHHPEDAFAWNVVDQIFPLRALVFPKLSGAAAVSAAVSRLLSRVGLARTLREIVSKIRASGLDERTKNDLEALVREGAEFERRPEEGGDLVRFREYLESVASRETAASPRVVRILTIHRAKGLTLDHVIVPICEQGAKLSIVKPDKSGKIPILSGDGWAVSLNKAEREAFAADYPALADAWGRESNEHLLAELRTYYVALTRARKSTHVFVVREERKPDAAPQFRDLLLAPFKNASTQKTVPWGTVLYATGTMPPFEKKEAPKNEVATWTHKRSDPPIEHGTPSSQKVAVPGDGKARHPLSPFAEGFSAAAERGTSEHAALAGIGWIDPDAPKDGRERAILESAWREAFVETPGAVLWRERSYELLVGDVWETGQFDRVVFRGEGDARTATVYDFKTNRRRDGETDEAFAERMKREYAVQMAAYRRALSLLCDIPGERIETVLLLSATMRAVPVPPLPTNVWLWDDEALGPCPAPIRLDRPSGPNNPWNPKDILDIT